MSENDIAAPVIVGNRRGFTGLQIAQSPALRAFIRANPAWFEPGPDNLDVMLIVEPDGTSWHPGLGDPREHGGGVARVEWDADGLPYVGYAPPTAREVSAGYAIEHRRRLR